MKPSDNRSVSLPPYIPVEEPIRQEAKPESSKIAVPAAEPQTNVLRSEFDAFIYDRFKSQPKSIEEVEAKVAEKPRDGRHNLSLPDELEPFTKKFAFCWIFKHKRAVDEACTLYHWVLCNKSHFSEVADKAPHIFSASGAVERGDEILAFRSRAIDEFMRKAPGLESAQKIKERKEAHLNDPAFYVPQSDEWETDPRTGKRVKVPIVGV